MATRGHEVACQELLENVVVLWPSLDITEKFQWVSALVPLYHLPELEIANMIESRIGGHS